MTYLRNSILATIIYYDILDFPVTLLEVYKYLINPGRLHRLAHGVGGIELAHILEALGGLIKSSLIEQKNGFYFLSGRSHLYDLRIGRQKIADQKWKKFLKLSRWLALVPYLKGMFASGSMALDNTDKNSDFDVLVIARSGRLYTCRLFLWLVTSLLGVRRKRFERTAPNKFCFNHYITDQNLSISHESLFNAQTYVNLKPVLISSELLDQFYVHNLWLNNYVYNFKIQKEFTRRSITAPLNTKAIAKTEELMLNSFVGEWFERILRLYQQKRIRNNPATYQSGGRVVFTEQELEFHPHSFEKIVLARYKEGLNRFGIVPFVEEKDSGLS